MEPSVLPVVVSYRSNLWIRVALRSYRRHFPDGMILVVDNNPKPGAPGWEPECEEERAWLRSLPDILLVENPRPRKKHGAALDLAASWCRENGYEFLLAFEPDCLITGRRWFEELWAAVARGAWMAGAHKKAYGPIHPCPSLWRVARIQASFDNRVRGEDEQHPRFRELFDLDRLMRTVAAEGGPVRWWARHWDTAQRAWFLAAVNDRAALAPKTDDFRHFWCGSSSNRRHRALREDPRLVALLAEPSAGLAVPAVRPAPAMGGARAGRRPRFCIVTPTIPGRERSLRAAIASAQAQDFQDFAQWVVSDGPCPGAADVCASMGVRFASTPKRERAYGASCRNRVLDEADADYFLFLDDDNLLFRGALARLHEAALAAGDPPLLAQKIVFLPRHGGGVRIFPEALPPRLGLWDQLCACVRGDVARRARFPSRSCNDYHYIMECINISGAVPILVDNVGGVHI